MIFTNCECYEPIVVAWESGMKQGYYRTDCEKCGRIAMTKLSSFDGETTILKNEEELEKFIKDKGLNAPNQA